MIYLGLDTLYDHIPHHNMLFARDYERNVTEVMDTLTLSYDPTIYVQNACVTDPSLAPAGKSTLYILVPAANNRSNLNWQAVKDSYRDRVLSIVETRAGFDGLRGHIEVERTITPEQWETSANVYRGAVFSLSHNLKHLLYFRPHNAFEECRNCYLVGGGTHPGSGLPTIYRSAIISAELILKRDGRRLRRDQ